MDKPKSYKCELWIIGYNDDFGGIRDDYQFSAEFDGLKTNGYFETHGRHTKETLVHSIVSEQAPVGYGCTKMVREDRGNSLLLHVTYSRIEDSYAPGS